MNFVCQCFLLIIERREDLRYWSSIYSGEGSKSEEERKGLDKGYLFSLIFVRFPLFFRFPSLLVARKLHGVALRHMSYLFRLLFTVCHSSAHFRFFSLFSTTLKGLLYKYGLITIAALEISVATERVGVSRCRAYSKRVFRTNCALRIKKCAPRIYSGIYFLSTS